MQILKKVKFFFLPQSERCKAAVSCEDFVFLSSYLLSQMHLQAEWESLMVISVCVTSSSASSFTPSTLDHNWRLLEPVKRVLPGYTKTYSRFKDRYHTGLVSYNVLKKSKHEGTDCKRHFYTLPMFQSTCGVPGQVPYHRL